MSEAFIFNKHCRLSWFGHVCRRDTLPKIIPSGTVDSSGHRRRPLKSWNDNIKEWTGQSILSLQTAESPLAAIAAEASVEVPNNVWVSWGIS